MKKHPVLMRLLADLLCAGIGLCVFALFHHVLPRRQESLGIVIENPYRTEDKEAGDGDTGSLGLDPAMLTASAGISDSGTLSAAGSRKNSGGKNGNSKGGSALTEDGTEEAEAQRAECGKNDQGKGQNCHMISPFLFQFFQSVPCCTENKKCHMKVYSPERNITVI